MSKYIDAEKLIAEIERLQQEVRNKWKENPRSSIDDGFLTACSRFFEIITSHQQEHPMLPGIEDPGIPGKDFIPVEWVEACQRYGKWKIVKQEQPELTQVPRIEQEIQKKGWMNYSLLISEIGLHRSNAIDRIKETKERAAEIKRNIAPHDLAILGKYLESVGAEIVLCCLQQYCMDFMFTQDEVKEIIQHEQPEVDLVEEITRFFSKNPIPHEHITDWPLLKNTAIHFYELGLNSRKEENMYDTSNCPYFSENCPVCDDGECGCIECLERIEELNARKEE